VSVETMKMLSELDWHFDNAPDNELVACCYWEYARESPFIRNVRQQCLQNWRAGAAPTDRPESSPIKPDENTNSQPPGKPVCSVPAEPDLDRR